jgi:hypothetical protein
MIMRLLINNRVAGNSMLFAMLAAWLTITVVMLTHTAPNLQVAAAEQTTPRY